MKKKSISQLKKNYGHLSQNGSGEQKPIGEVMAIALRAACKDLINNYKRGIFFPGDITASHTTYDKFIVSVTVAISENKAIGRPITVTWLSGTE